MIILFGPGVIDNAEETIAWWQANFEGERAFFHFLSDSIISDLGFIRMTWDHQKFDEGWPVNYEAEWSFVGNFVSSLRIEIGGGGRSFCVLQAFKRIFWRLKQFPSKSRCQWSDSDFRPLRYNACQRLVLQRYHGAVRVSLPDFCRSQTIRSGNVH